MWGGGGALVCNQNQASLKPKTLPKQTLKVSPVRFHASRANLCMQGYLPFPLVYQHEIEIFQAWSNQVATGYDSYFRHTFSVRTTRNWKIVSGEGRRHRGQQLHLFLGFERRPRVKVARRVRKTRPESFPPGTRAQAEHHLYR